MYELTFGRIEDVDQRMSVSKDKIDLWARAFKGNRGLSPIPLDEIRHFKGIFHGILTPTNTILCLIGVYADRVGKLDVLNEFWRVSIKLPTKLLKLATGEVSPPCPSSPHPL